MQTFLPYSSFQDCVMALDWKRLGKQRVEAFQILKALSVDGYGWRNHPAVKMWRGYEEALKYYMNLCILEWERRGKNNIKMRVVEMGNVVYPYWLGDERLHSSHRSNLLRKYPEYYSKFNWAESSDLPYYWPVI